MDWIYIDPSRSNDAKAKFLCSKIVYPMFLIIWNTILKIRCYTSKTPLLDISAGILELQNVKTIHIVALENDVETTMELHKDYTGTIEVKTINLLKDKTETLISTGTRNPILQTTACLNGIYMNQQCHNEIRGFDEVARFYTLNKLHKHSHLYTSVTLISFLEEFLRSKTVFLTVNRN
jgi:hypothetical protein